MKELTGGWGADVVVDVAGFPAVVAEGMKMMAQGARYVEIGNIYVGWKAEFDPAWIIFGNRRIIGLSHYEAEHLRGGARHDGAHPRAATRGTGSSPTSSPWRQIEEAFVQQDKGHVTRAAIVPN